MTDKDILQLYREMELELIDSMKRNLGLHLAEETETGLDYPQWQAIKLRELRKYQQENRDIIGGKTLRLSEEVAKQLRDELRQGHESEIAKFLLFRNAKKYKSAVAMNESFFKLNTRKVDALIEEVNGSLLKANHAALRMANDVYREVIFKTGLFVANGVMTEQQAYDRAMKDFLNRGLNCIEYKDGRRVNIADYTSMAVRTANQRAYMMGEGEFRKEIGNPLIIISRHDTSCELCAPFQNKVLIDDVYSGGTQDDGDYMLLSEAMDKGLYHPGCRHGLGTYYSEIDEIDREYDGYVERDVTDYGEYSKAHIENMIQRYKRLSLGSIDPDNVARYEAKLREWEDKLTSFNVANSENGGIIKAAKELSYSDKVNYNPDASFEVTIPSYSSTLNRKISEACRTVAELGGADENEHLILLDLESGSTVYTEIGEKTSVGDTGFWEYIANNGSGSFAFIHNHNTASSFSETDMRTLLGDNPVDMFIATRIDGIIYVVEKNHTPSILNFDNLYSNELEKINKLSRTGHITAGERTYLREKLIVDSLIRDYTKGLMIYE